MSRESFINYCRTTKTIAGRFYQDMTVFGKRHLDKRHPIRVNLIRADIISQNSQFQMLELLTTVQSLRGLSVKILVNLQALAVCFPRSILS
jgi:hypothetical protein